MKDLNGIRELNETAYRFLCSLDASKIEDGRLELENGLYVNIESYETQARSERLFESHRKYIDIQYMIKGEELITVAPITDLRVIDQYNEDKDIEFYEGSLNGFDYSIKSGEFLILKPGEGHMPCVALNGKKIVRKAVVKVPVCI